MPKIFEDLVPVTEDSALVTIGQHLGDLDTIARCPFIVNAHGEVTVDLSAAIVEVAGGKNLRLGHWLPKSDRMKGGVLVYSRAYYPGMPSVVGAKVDSPRAHQPYVYGGSVYYTDDWPEVRIYRQLLDEPEDFTLRVKMVVGHWTKDLVKKYCQVGNPHWDHERDVMYFEARVDSAPNRSDLWEVWKYDPQDETQTFVTPGANPAVFNNYLYWGEWNGRGFSYRCTAL